MHPHYTRHITKTSDGIWYYQRWLPLSVRGDSKPSLIRFSLSTKNFHIAALIAKSLNFNFEALASRYFNDGEGFGRAMRLLLDDYKAKLEQVNNGDMPHGLEIDHECDQPFLDEGLKFMKEIHELITYLQHENGKLDARLDHTLAALSAQPKVNSAAQQAISGNYSEQENPTLIDAFNSWVDAKNHSKKKPRSFDTTMKPAVELFVNFVTEGFEPPLRIADLGTQAIKQYKAFYVGLPRGTQTSTISIEKLKRLSGAKGKIKTAKTITDHFSHIVGFMKWAEGEGYIIAERAIATMGNANIAKDKGESSTTRTPYNDEDLKALFASAQYLKTGRFTTSAMYWAPLIALFTGARATEILQLTTDDICRLDGDKHWSINITDEQDGKHVKTASSKRIVPIHKTLVDLGLIEYRNALRPNSQLFPDEERNAHGKFDRFQKRYSYYRKSLLNKTQDGSLKDFHSFRHTVRTRLGSLSQTGPIRGRFPESLIDEVLGHKSGSQSIGQKVYDHSQKSEPKARAISRLQYDSVPFDKLISWRKCQFAQDRNFRQLMRSTGKT